MPISPSTVQLEPNQTQQFTQSGIGSPVWSVFGLGTINQSGLFTAGSSSSIVIAHEPAWASVNAATWTKQTDDSLVSTGSLDYFGSAISAGKLNATGDWCQAKLPYRTGYSPNKWGILNLSNTFGVYLEYGLSIREVATGYSVASSLSATANDIFTFTVNSGGKIEVKQNGTLIFTSVNSFTGLSLPFYSSCDYASGVVQTVPRFNASNSNYTSVEAVATVLPLILLTRTALELYCQSNTLSLTDNAAVSSFADLSGKGRNLTASSNQPVFKVEDNRIQWNGSQSALKNTQSFQLNCGFILAKYDSATFADYNGLLSDSDNIGIIAGNTGGNTLFNFGHSLYEFRSNDRIYPASAAPAPMNNFKLLFFKFWTPITVNGIQIGDDRNFSGRKWNGSVKLVALYSRHFCEKEIRATAKTISDAYSFTLADVFPYQADTASDFISSKKVLRSGNDEYSSVMRVKRGKKEKFKLNFTNRSQLEKDLYLAFWDSHHPELPFIVRDYTNIPPRDTEVLSLSDEVSKSPSSVNLWNYAFEVKEK
jgi:hypothetical protein